jgi:hypothetical protein
MWAKSAVLVLLASFSCLLLSALAQVRARGCPQQFNNLHYSCTSRHMHLAMH